MIDSLTIFSTGGTVLFCSATAAAAATAATSPSPPPIPVHALNQLIETILLENRCATDKTCTLRPSSSPGSGSKKSSAPAPSSVAAGSGGNLIAEWEEGGPSNSATGGSNGGGSASKKKKDCWVAVVLYRDVFKNRFPYVRDLLKSTLHEYALFHERVVTSDEVPYRLSADVEDTLSPHIPPPDPSLFGATFTALLRRAEKSTRSAANQPPAVTTGSTDKEDDDSEEETLSMDDKDNVTDENDSDGPVDTAEGLARLKARRERALNKHPNAAETVAKKKGKEKTVWHDGTSKVTKSALASLDRSKKPASGTGGINMDVQDDSLALAEARAAYLPATDEVTSWEDEETLNDDDLNLGIDGESSSGGGWFKGIIDQISGNKILNEDDIAPILEEMKSTLISKNVANDIAGEICDSVRGSLIGKRLQSFGRIKTAVRIALETAIARILTPHRNIDVLREVMAKRESQRSVKSGARRPYVIVMVGINGVGKSTSLAKIAYYLKSSGCSPLLAACDTFRSGAVEQLSVHAKCLEVPLFQRGYAKDPSSVARAAITHAGNEGHDVVLVDTAGRMQNNVPLMNALSKLVVENRPDLVLFVGEALVGNDGIDQLKMFDQALRTGGHARNIDGIVLTKFDTVSDKVGAALTMTHITGQPVVFVGTGQKYNHLKKLSVPAVIKSLFS